MIDLTLLLSIGFDAAEIFKFVEANSTYFMVFLLMVVESSFIPFPSEAVVPPATYFMLSAIGTLDIGVVASVVLAATAGALGGALINYYLSLWLGRPIVYRFANSRIGHFFLVTEDKVIKSEAYFDKHGPTATFIGRLIPAVRQLISIPAGLSRMNIAKFCIFTSLGACIWNIVLSALGAWLFTAVDKNVLYEKVEEYNSYLTIGGLCLLGACVVYLIYKASTAKRINTVK